MSKIIRISSFDEFTKLGAKKIVKEDKKYSSIKKELVKPSRKIQSKVKPLKESATFKVGDVFKVKSTFDVPVSMVKDYIDKVKKESSKNPLDNFSHTEIAEELVKHIVISNMNLANMPTSITVGESTIENDIESESSNKEDDEFDGEDFQIDDLEDEDYGGGEEVEIDDEGDNDIKFTTEEADLDEDIELESDEK